MSSCNNEAMQLFIKLMLPETDNTLLQAPGFYECISFFLSSTQREEILSEFPKEVQKQNQFVLNLIYQFGDSLAETVDAMEHIQFTILGKPLCETCLCILFDLSEWRYERIKNFYRVSICQCELYT